MAPAVSAIGEPSDPDDDDGEEARTTNPVVAEDRRPRRIALVIDDSEDIQNLCRGLLEDEGFFVQTAGNGREALDLLFVIPTPTVILLDLLMPEMDGHELLDVLRSYRRLAEVPVLVITACDDATIAGARTSLLRKPIVGGALVEGVRALLGEASAP